MKKQADDFLIFLVVERKSLVVIIHFVWKIITSNNSFCIIIHYV